MPPRPTKPREMFFGHFIPAEFKSNKCTLRLDLLVEKLRRLNVLKGHGGRMAFIAEKPYVKKLRLLRRH